MALVKGKDYTIYVGTTSPPTTKVGKTKDPDFDATIATADSTTSDSGDYEEHETIRLAGDLTFKALTDPADPGQIIIRTAIRTLAKIHVEFREQGDGPGKPGERFLASWSMKRSSPIGDLAATNFTCKPSGVRTPVVQT